MSSCLGIYIENNIIKYAKVSKEREQLKVESYGVKFYDNIDQTIKQIVEETYSYKTPISINLSEEIYNYFNMFALLSKKDLPKAIKTEFEAYCSDKNYNPNVFETRYAIAPNVQDKEKLKVIHISQNKIELNKKIQRFNGYRLQDISPIGMTIPDVKEFEPKENALIVNIEEKTTITTILDQKVYDVKTLDVGSQEFLDKINIKENSYSKAYEICKETTIYTSEGRDLTDVDTNYLEDIMPTLYEIVGQIRKIMNESIEKIDRVYITGTAALINNIDLYFEEYLENVKCEILKPGFIKISPEINIKDYVEVNSAISLAISGLGEGITGINFKKASLSDRLPDFLKIEIGSSKKDKNKSSKPNPLEKLLKSSAFTMDFNVPLDKVEKGMLRTATGLLILFFVYSGFSTMIKNQIDNKMDEANKSIANTNSQMKLIDNDKSKLQTKTTEYTTKISNLQKVNDKINDINKTKKAIPNLLNKLMYIMPTGVQITSIQNTSATHIEIQAQSNKYEQLGFLVTNMQLEPVLTNVISTAGQKANGVITIKIEGDLP
jgi:Tfp pilus assembly protein PilN